ncbi:unannotated protein [freshwater metagenome]|uniref:Unannotated protein n=1 Tax=freshwater metagenome TaxID=449393 RepID=A0A6J6PKS7_9ZZZZ
MPVSVEIRRGTARFVTRAPGRETRHSFSFGEHYDPERTGFGPLVCHDDHMLAAGTGFETHRHADLEIVTWVVSGALRHTGDSGAPVVVPAGSLAVLSTGDGVEHSEIAVEGAGPTRFVQVWLRPDRSGGASSYAVAALEPAPGSLVPSPLPVAVGGAAFAVAHLTAGQELLVPAAPRTHVYVARGALIRSSLADPLQAGDAFEMLGEPDRTLVSAADTQLLVWTFAS